MEQEAKKIEEMTPEFMNMMLMKQPREEAIQKREERKAMVVKDVPPTTPGYKVYCISHIILNN